MPNTSQQFLADKMSECCCSIKEKVDAVKEHADHIDRDRLRDNLNVTRDQVHSLKSISAVKEQADNIDRDRLRDNLSVSREEANMLKLNEYNQLYWNNGRFGGCGGYGGYGGWGGERGWNSDERRGYGNVYNNFDIDEGRRRGDDRRGDDRRGDDRRGDDHRGDRH